MNPDQVCMETKLKLTIFGPGVESLCMVLSRDYLITVLEWRQLTLFKGYAIITGYDPEIVDIEGYAINDGTFIKSVEILEE